MKSPGLTPCFYSATLFLAGGLWAADLTASADKPAAAPTPAPPMSTSRTGELLGRFDLNHDGKLDEDETAAAHEALLKERMDRQAAQEAQKTVPSAEPFRQRMLQMFDKNHNGRLDDEERAEARSYMEAHGLGPDGEVRAELLKRFDKNADGKLDDGERAEMERFLQERRAQAAATMRASLLRQFDKNGDGKIDAAEMVELERVMRPRLEASPQQLQRYDKNHDGHLDDAEWATVREQIIRLLNDPPPAPPAEAKASTAKGPGPV